MSCRIDRAVDDNLTVLSISGTITGQHVDTLRTVLQQEAGAVAIDLKNVSLVDRDGVQLLALSEDSGMEIRNCPAYIREWVARERTESEG
jgi:anti-anti-sigma regulatory factor